MSSVRPNESRLSCGATLERLQTQFYHTRRAADSFRRMLGSALECDGIGDGGKRANQAIADETPQPVLIKVL